MTHRGSGPYREAAVVEEAAPHAPVAVVDDESDETQPVVTFVHPVAAAGRPAPAAMRIVLLVLMSAVVLTAQLVSDWTVQRIRALHGSSPSPVEHRR